MVLEITDTTFEKTVLNSNKPVLIKFWSENCGACRMIEHVIDKIGNDYKNKAIVGKIDVNKNKEFAAEYGIRSVPAVLIFNNGKIVDKHIGVSLNPNTFTDKLDSII